MWLVDGDPMNLIERSSRVAHGTRRRRARRPASVATVVGTTVVASLLYGLTGSWSWASTIETGSDGRPLTDVQLSGAASGWGWLVILVLGGAAWALSRNPGALPTPRHERGVGRLTADHLISWMWLYLAAVWIFTIVQAVVAVQLVQHQIVPPFLINGTVHIHHF